MAALPEQDKLPVNLLSGIFNNTTATYKFYWFLAILESVVQGQLNPSYKLLFIKMICKAWYTVNYFKVSFGSHDKLQSAIQFLIEKEGLSPQSNAATLEKALMETEKQESLRMIYHFKSQVPHWFLQPWFPGVNKNSIIARSNQFHKSCLYSLEQDSISINPIWVSYLKKQNKVLTEFTLWNLAYFLQTRNPNVPQIVTKLVKPKTRIPMTSQRNYWRSILRSLGSIYCIYTGKRLTEASFHIEHFIPFSFVPHNLIWNLIPADPSFNIIKSNRLPILNKHLPSFTNIQFDSFIISAENRPGNKVFEDYYSILPSLDSKTINAKTFTKKLEGTIRPLHALALNNGFQQLEE